MGTVSLAIREQDKSIVALKTILPGTVVNPRDQQRFLREAEILQQLLHPHIVAYRESGECDGLLYFSMEYVPGRGANALVKKSGGQLPVARAAKIVQQLLTALRYAHAEGFVHRDIKPSNLLIIDDHGDLLKLADFGLARAYQASGMSGMTMTGDIGGTIGFMSPEQITDFRRSQPATDQYAAAATLYYLLTGRFVHDFPDDPGKRLMMILDKEPVPIRDRRPEVPKDLAAAIHRALSHDPNDRFPDVRAMYVAIEPFARTS
jgi:serine/threonine-protein kinase